MKRLKTYESIFDGGTLKEQIEDLFVGIADEVSVDKILVLTKTVKNVLLVYLFLKDGDPRDPETLYGDIKSKILDLNKTILKKFGYIFIEAEPKSTLTPGYGRTLRIRYYKKIDTEIPTIVKNYKTYESFEYDLSGWVNKFLSNSELTMEDIEDIFLEYSDLGYLVRFLPNWVNTVSGIFVDVTGDFSEKKSEPFGAETIKMINRIKNNSERLGLTFGDYPERLNDFISRNGIRKGTIRFYLVKK